MKEINIKELLLDLDEVVVALEEAKYGVTFFVHRVEKEDVPETHSRNLIIFVKEVPSRFQKFFQRFKPRSTADASTPPNETGAPLPAPPSK